MSHTGGADPKCRGLGAQPPRCRMVGGVAPHCAKGLTGAAPRDAGGSQAPGESKLVNLGSVHRLG